MAELQELKGKNWMAAMALCWLVGPLGGHRFYTGKVSTGWAMAILSLVGAFFITWIWAFVDGIMLATNSYRHEDGSELYERVEWFGWTYVTLQVLAILGTIAYIGVIMTMFATFMGAAAGAISSGSGI